MIDKRLTKNKKFGDLSHQDKEIFLLERILDQLENNVTNNILIRQSRILLFISKLLIDSLDLQNKPKEWTDNYIKTLKAELDRI